MHYRLVYYLSYLLSLSYSPFFKTHIQATTHLKTKNPFISHSFSSFPKLIYKLLNHNHRISERKSTEICFSVLFLFLSRPYLSHSVFQNTPIYATVAFLTPKPLYLSCSLNRELDVSLIWPKPSSRDRKSVV